MNSRINTSETNNVKIALRLSPIHDSLQTLDGTWREINGMPTLAIVSTTTMLDAKNAVAIADLSCLTRFGVKGSGAADWLAQQDIPIPANPNTWCALRDGGIKGGIIARLGITEFLIEEDASLTAFWSNGFDPPLPLFRRGELSESPPFQGGFRGISDGAVASKLDSQSPPELEDLGGNTLVAQLIQAAHEPPPQVYPVLRQDLTIALYGTAVDELLLQTCSVNFRALSWGDRPVVMTSMVGVAVIVIPGDCNGIPWYRIWCDGTFGVYFWDTLLAIAQELGGGAIGIEQVQTMKDKGVMTG